MWLLYLSNDPALLHFFPAIQVAQFFLYVMCSIYQAFPVVLRLNNRFVDLGPGNWGMGVIVICTIITGIMIFNALGGYGEDAKKAAITYINGRPHYSTINGMVKTKMDDILFGFIFLTLFFRFGYTFLWLGSIKIFEMLLKKNKIGSSLTLFPKSLFIILAYFWVLEDYRLL